MSGSSLHAPADHRRAPAAPAGRRLRRPGPGAPRPSGRAGASRRSSALLDDPAVELVVVAAPNAAHHELARTALRGRPARRGRQAVHRDHCGGRRPDPGRRRARPALERVPAAPLGRRPPHGRGDASRRACSERSIPTSPATTGSAPDRRRGGPSVDRPGAGRAVRPRLAPDRPGAVPVRHPADGLGGPRHPAPGRRRGRLRPPRSRVRPAPRAPARRLAGPGARAAVRGARRPRVVRQGRDGRPDRRAAGRPAARATPVGATSPDRLRHTDH